MKRLREEYLTWMPDDVRARIELEIATMETVGERAAASARDDVETPRDGTMACETPVLARL